MKPTIHTKLILGLLPGLFFLIIIGGAGYLSLSSTSDAAHELLAEAIETATTGKDPILPPEAILQSQLQRTVDEIAAIHLTAGRIILISTIFAVWGGAIFAFFFSRSLSRPIVALSQGARRIGEGDLTYRLNIQANDEIGQFAQVFNHMADQLQESYTTLEQRVAERTQELAMLNLEEQRQRQLADTLRRVSRSLVSSLNLEEVLNGILEQIGQVLIVDAGLILLVEGERLRVAAVRGRPELTMEQWLGYSFESQASPYLSQVLKEKQPNTFCDPKRMDLFRKGIGRIEAVQWCLVVPLLSGEEVIGLLTLEQIGHCYDQVEEGRVAFTFANHAAIAIQNARLYAEVQSLNTDLEARVQQRTAELIEARDTLDHQAQQLRELYNLTIEVQEAERNRIAHDIHDGVTQWTLGALYELEAAKVCWHNRPEAAMQKVVTAQEILKGIKTEMYRVIHNLHPPLLESDGLVTAIKTYAAEYQEVNGLPCWVEVQGTPRRLEAGQELSIYRIAQEALRNVATHAQASRVRVIMVFEPELVTLQVADNGRGFALEQMTGRHPGHLGLVGMRERAQSIGGELTFHSTPGSGVTVNLTLPVRLNQEEYAFA